MSDQEKNSVNEENVETENTAETNPEAASVDPIVAKDQRIAELEEALAIATKNEKEAMLRARAEIDNVRRRVEADVEKAHKFALEKFSAALLPVIDNLERALELTDRSNSELAPTIEGVELTLKSLLDAVNKFGVQAVDQDNVPFNPDVHEAMSMVPSPDHAPNHVMSVIQKGYTLNGRLIRPAMVIVSKQV